MPPIPRRAFTWSRTPKLPFKIENTPGKCLYITWHTLVDFLFPFRPHVPYSLSLPRMAFHESSHLAEDGVGAFIIGIIFRIAVDQYYCLAGITVLYYDHIITLPEEIRHIWRQKLSLVNFLFLLNRYLLFAGYIVYLFFIFDAPLGNASCSRFHWMPGILTCVTQGIIAILLVLRCYALYYGNTWLLVGMSTLGFATVATAAWAMTQVMSINLEFKSGVFQTCLFSGLKSSLPFKVYWSLSFAFDFLVFLLTVFKTYRLWMGSKTAGSNSSLPGLLMRDGAVYFIGLGIVNIVNLIIFVDEDTTFAQQSTGNNSVITHTISSVMIARMVLNLRELNAFQAQGSQLSTLNISNWVAQIRSTVTGESSSGQRSGYTRTTDTSLLTEEVIELQTFKSSQNNVDEQPPSRRIRRMVSLDIVEANQDIEIYDARDEWATTV